MLRDAAGHPDHDARVALPAAHLARARDAEDRRDGDPRRGARRRRHEARRPPRALARAARARRRAARSSGSASRRRSARWRRSAASSPGRRARSSSSTPGSARSSTWRSSSRVEDMRELGANRAALASPSMPDGVEMDSGYEATARSIWPSIYPALLELVRAHRSTIVFVNNRRLAERLALRLNELARRTPKRRSEHREVARAHHGSLAREQRRRDRGGPEGGPDPVPRRDLVARARDRHGRRRPRHPGREPEVGRARPAARRPRRPRARRTSRRGASSRSSAPTCSSAPSSRRRCARARSRRPRSRATRSTCSRSRSSRSAPTRRSRSTICTTSSAAPTRSPTSPARSSRTCSTCSPGRYPSDEFAELRPRIVWDRTAGVIRGPNGRAPARGHERGHDPRPRPLRRLPGRRRRPRRRARRGDGLRGARGPDVHARRLDLADRGDHPRPRARLAGAGRARARCRSGRARASGGRTSSASKIGEASRELVALSDERPPSGCATTTTSTSSPRGTCSPSCASRSGAGALPSDRTIVVERFRDEIGDWRVCILTPFGGRVHAPWAMALAARLRDSLGARGAVDLVGRRDRAPPPRRRRAARRSPTCSSSPTSSRTSSCRRSAATALFGARFRENAARALLIPRRRPGQRTPLWQQRLKAQSLLQVARKYGSFPIVLETYRECLQDVFDLPALRGILRGLSTRRARPRRGRDAVRLAVRRLAALRLRRHVHVRGRHARRRAARAGALARPRPAARAARPGGAARPARPGRARRGRGARCAGSRGTPTSCTTSCAASATCATGELDAGFAETPRARAARVPGARRRRGAADRGRGRRALPRRARRDAARRPARGVPRGRPRTRSSVSLLRFARSRGPFTTGERRRALRARAERRRGAPARSSRRATCSSAASSAPAASSASGATRTSCAASAARRSPPCAGRSSRPSRPRSAASCPRWHGIDRRATLREALVPLQGLALPVALWETEVLPRRVPGYQPASLDQLCASGEVVWVGAGLDRVALYFREDAPCSGRRRR